MRSDLKFLKQEKKSLKKNSHNQSSNNGVKFFNTNGYKLSSVEELEIEKSKLAQLQLKVKNEYQRKEDELRRTNEKKLQQELEKQNILLREQVEKAKEDLEEAFAKKSERLQLKAIKSLQQVVAHSITVLGQGQQSVLHLITPTYLQSLRLLSETEFAALLSQIMAMRETLEESERKLKSILFGQSLNGVEQNVIEAKKEGNND